MTYLIKERTAQRGSPRRRRKTPEPSVASLVPPLGPAALEPAWAKGKLILLPSSAASDGGAVVLAMALKLLRAEIARLAADADCDAMIDQRSIDCLRSVAGRIPAYAPAQEELFYLAHLKEFLEVYAETSSKGWPSYFAERFAAVTGQFDRTVQQFPKWRDFVRHAEDDSLTFEEAAEISTLAKWMIAALREDEARNLIDPAIPLALEVFRAPLQNDTMRPGQQIAGPGEASMILLADDLLASIDNITKRAVEAALVFGNSMGPVAKMGLTNEGLSAGDRVSGQAYRWMAQTLLQIVTSMPTLTRHSKFRWLEPIAGLLNPKSEASSLVPPLP